jgi:hypothetical protein
VAGALGWLHDLGGGDIHVDASGHLDAGHAHPISGTIVATFITGFGAGGIVGHYLLLWPLLGGLALAAGSGLALAFAAFLTLEMIFKHTQAGSEFDTQNLANRDAEVITAIPEGGTGEVAYLVKGQRDTTAARAADGKRIAKGQLVTIERVTGSVAYVRAKD